MSLFIYLYIVIMFFVLDIVKQFLRFVEVLNMNSTLKQDFMQGKMNGPNRSLLSTFLFICPSHIHPSLIHLSLIHPSLIHLSLILLLLSALLLSALVGGCGGVSVHVSFQQIM